MSLPSVPLTSIAQCIQERGASVQHTAVWMQETSRKEQREGAEGRSRVRAGPQQRNRDVRTEPGACLSCERGVSHGAETRLSEQGVCRSASAWGDSHGDTRDQTFLKCSPDVPCFLESLTHRAESSRHCCLI